VRLSSSDTLAKIAAARKTEPARLSRLVRGELDWIVMKCLEKDRTRRYETVNGLARDVERYLHDEPVGACPPSAGYRLRKFARKYKKGLAAAAGFALLLLAGIAVSTWQAVRATRAEGEAVTQRDLATEAERDATAKRHEAETAREQLRRTLYAAHLNLAQTAWEGSDIVRALDLLDAEKRTSPDLCGFEYYYWQRRCHGDLRTIPIPGLTHRCAFSPDGTRLVSKIADPEHLKEGAYSIKVWDTTSGKEVLSFRAPQGGYSPVFSPDGQRLAITSGELWDLSERGEVSLWDAARGEKLRTLEQCNGWPGFPVFSGDGKRIAAVVQTGPHGRRQGTVQVWDADTGKALRAIPGVVGDFPALAISPDGRRLAVVFGDQGRGRLTVWDADSGQPLCTARTNFAEDAGVAFSPDGRRLFTAGHTAGESGELSAWDATTGQRLFAVPGHFGFGWFVRFAFSPDGARVACAGADPRVGVWDAATGREAFSLRGHRDEVTAVVFSPDGKHLLTAGGDDQTIKVWDTVPRDERVLLQENASRITSVAFSPDARRLATADQGGRVKVWDATGRALLTLEGPVERAGEHRFAAKLAFDRDGRRLALASGATDRKTFTGTLIVWDAAGKQLLAVEDQAGGFSGLAFSPDGRRVAAALYVGDPKKFPLDGEVKVWDVATGKELFGVRAPADLIPYLAFSPDGSRLAEGVGFMEQAQATEIRVWDAETGQVQRTWKGHPRYLMSLAFSPDGQRIATWGGDLSGAFQLIVWDAATGAKRWAVPGEAGYLQGLAFSPDGTRLAGVGSVSNKPAEILLWEADTGQQVLTLRGHAGMVGALAFPPDGQRLVSAALLSGQGAEVKVWDATPLANRKP
jgi:eukaryotic-like serine/threonine-protein kinase